MTKKRGWWLQEASEDQKEKITSRGGNATFAKYGREYMRELGRKGGRAVVAKHGSEHMAAIGTVGGASTKNRAEGK